MKRTEYFEFFRFDISNTEHVKTVKIMDRVTIMCPMPSNVPYEYSKLYVVSCNVPYQKSLERIKSLTNAIIFRTQLVSSFFLTFAKISARLSSNRISHVHSICARERRALSIGPNNNVMLRTLGCLLFRPIA